MGACISSTQQTANDSPPSPSFPRESGGAQRSASAAGGINKNSHIAVAKGNSISSAPPAAGLPLRIRRLQLEHQREKEAAAQREAEEAAKGNGGILVPVGGRSSACASLNPLVAGHLAATEEAGATPDGENTTAAAAAAIPAPPPSAPSQPPLPSSLGAAVLGVGVGGGGKPPLATFAPSAAARCNGSTSRDGHPVPPLSMNRNMQTVIRGQRGSTNTNASTTSRGVGGIVNMSNSKVVAGTSVSTIRSSSEGGGGGLSSGTGNATGGGGSTFRPSALMGSGGFGALGASMDIAAPATLDTLPRMLSVSGQSSVPHFHSVQQQQQGCAGQGSGTIASRLSRHLHNGTASKGHPPASFAEEDAEDEATGGLLGRSLSPFEGSSELFLATRLIHLTYGTSTTHGITAAEYSSSFSPPISAAGSHAPPPLCSGNSNSKSVDHSPLSPAQGGEKAVLPHDNHNPLPRPTSDGVHTAFKPLRFPEVVRAHRLQVKAANEAVRTLAIYGQGPRKVATTTAASYHRQEGPHHFAQAAPGGSSSGHHSFGPRSGGLLASRFNNPQPTTAGPPQPPPVVSLMSVHSLLSSPTRHSSNANNAPISTTGNAGSPTRLPTSGVSANPAEGVVSAAGAIMILSPCDSNADDGSNNRSSTASNVSSANGGGPAARRKTVVVGGIAPPKKGTFFHPVLPTISTDCYDDGDDVYSGGGNSERLSPHQAASPLTSTTAKGNASSNLIHKRGGFQRSSSNLNSTMLSAAGQSTTGTNNTSVYSGASVLLLGATATEAYAEKLLALGREGGECSTAQLRADEEDDDGTMGANVNVGTNPTRKGFSFMATNQAGDSGTQHRHTNLLLAPPPPCADDGFAPNVRQCSAEDASPIAITKGNVGFGRRQSTVRLMNVKGGCDDGVPPPLPQQPSSSEAVVGLPTAASSAGGGGAVGSGRVQRRPSLVVRTFSSPTPILVPHPPTHSRGGEATGGAVPACDATAGVDARESSVSYSAPWSGVTSPVKVLLPAGRRGGGDGETFSAMTVGGGDELSSSGGGERGAAGAAVALTVPVMGGGGEGAPLPTSSSSVITVVRRRRSRQSSTAVADDDADSSTVGDHNQKHQTQQQQQNPSSALPLIPQRRRSTVSGAV